MTQGCDDIVMIVVMELEPADEGSEESSRLGSGNAETQWAVQTVAVAMADCGLTTDHHWGRRFILTNVASQQAYKVGITILNLKIANRLT